MKRLFKACLLSGLMLLFLSQNISAQRAIDFLQIQGNSEELFLRIISEADAISAGNGVVKIQLPDGSTGAADLVATSDPDASELRIQTPYGTRAWREETFYGKCYGGSEYDYGNAIAPAADGGLAICGYTDSYGAGSTDYLLIKVEEDGSFDWGKAYGNSSHGRGESILQTNSGGYLITGYENSTIDGSNYAYFYKLNSSGSIILEGGFGTSTTFERSYDAIQLSDNNFVLVGTSGGGANGDDFFVQKFNGTTGAGIWGNTIGTATHDNGRAIQERSDGGYVAVGSTNGYGGFANQNVYFLLLASDGTEELSLAIGGSYDDQGFDVLISNDGNYVIAGSSNSIGGGLLDVYLLKYDTNGDPVWSAVIGGTGEDGALALTEAKDGGLLIAGYTNSYGAGFYDLWLIKTDDAGNPEWSWVFGGSGAELGRDVYLDPNGCIYVCGETTSYGTGQRDALLVKFSPDGKTCLGYEVTPGSDNMVPEGFTATRMDHFNVDRTSLPTRKIEAHCIPLKQDLQQQNLSGRGEISITPTVSTICN